MANSAMESASRAATSGSDGAAAYWNNAADYFSSRSSKLLDPVLDAQQAFADVVSDYNNGLRVAKALGSEVIGPVINITDMATGIATGDVDKTGTALSGMAIDLMLAALGFGVATVAGLSVAPALLVAGAVAAVVNLTGADRWLWDNHLKGIFQGMSDFTYPFWEMLFDRIPGLSQVSDGFNDARDFVPRRDPLVLDLDGDGIETVGATGSILFDHDGDGVRSGTGWIAPDDGLLVLDRNGNGLIDNGGELFGADTLLSDGHKATSGFEALADLDSNEDGVFNNEDAQFADVRVWRDLNQDGVSQAGELFTLNQLGIAAIDLTPTTTVNLDLGNGNVVDNRGMFTRIDGTTGQAGDLLLGKV